MNALLEALGLMGWSTSAHCLIQATIATLTGGSALFAALHPATIIVGSAIGLAWALKDKLKSNAWPQPHKEQFFTYCVIRITVDVPSIRL